MPVETSTEADAQIDDLLAFLSTATSPYHAAAEVERRLVGAGFATHSRGGDLATVGDVPGVVMRRGGALIAWLSGGPRAEGGFRIYAAHTDSPNLRLRPRPDAGSAGWKQMIVEPYGGLLLNSWLDRELGLSGRLVVGERATLPVHEGTRLPVGSDLAEVLVQLDEPLLRIPQLAIHLDRDIGPNGLKLNPQQHLTPVWALGAPLPGEALAFIAERAGLAGAEVLGFDLMTHVVDPARRWGADRAFIASGRLDNLVSAWAGCSALVAAARKPTEPGAQPVIVLFDHEEVGSTSATGALSALLGRTLSQIDRRAGLDEDASIARLERSLVWSVDMAHATHPNYVDKHEPHHAVVAGEGVAVKVSSGQRYASSAVGIAVVEQLANSLGETVQLYSHRADLRCGSTVGPHVAANLGVECVDLGAPQLAMHSARESMVASDALAMLHLTSSWFAAR